MEAKFALAGDADPEMLAVYASAAETEDSR
jgi:hypothetical protein